MSPATGDCRSPFISGSFIKERIRPPAMEKYRNSVKLVRAEVSGSNTREPTTRNSTNTRMESSPPNSRYVPDRSNRLQSVCPSAKRKRCIRFLLHKFEVNTSDSPFFFILSFQKDAVVPHHAFEKLLMGAGRHARVRGIDDYDILFPVVMDILVYGFEIFEFV